MGIAVVKNRVWPGLRYRPHAGQRKIHDSLARNRVAACGRRFGKSIVGGRELTPEAIKTHELRHYLKDVGKRREFWVVGPDYSDGEKEFRVVYNDLKRLEFPFDRPGTYNNPQTGDMRISLWDATFVIQVMSAKYYESLDGEGLSGVLLVEAAKLKELVWDKYIRPALSDERGWSLMTSTPEGKNWFYEKWQDGKKEELTDWSSWRMPTWMNTVRYPGGREDPEILSMKRELSPERYNQQVAAMFTEFVGQVFKSFDEEIHVGSFNYRADLPVYLAIDYGWTNPFVALAIQEDVFGNVYVLDEYRITNRDIEDIAGDLQRWGPASNVTEIFPDPAGPGDTNVLMRHLRCRANGDTGGELKWRLELIRRHLKLYPEDQPDITKRRPKLYIDRKCVGNPLGDGGLIREMQDYRYPDTKKESNKAAPEEPIDKDNHAPEALGRYFRGRFGGPEGEETRGHAVVRKAVIRTGAR